MKKKNIFTQTSFLLFALLLAFSFFTCGGNEEDNPIIDPENPGGEDDGPPNFKVEGTKILDLDGNEFIVKGTNVNGPGFKWPGDGPETVSYLGNTVVDLWKFNTVRINMTRTSATIGMMKPLVDACTEKEIVCILELHDYTNLVLKEGDPKIEQLKTWWIRTATEYKDNPYVWFNILNEPGNAVVEGTGPWVGPEESATRAAAVYDEVIAAIRETGANNIIILDEHDSGKANQYSTGKNSFDSIAVRMGPELITKYKNLVFSPHIYGDWTIANFRNYFNDTAELGLCIVVGEYALGFKDANAAFATYNVFKRLWDEMLPRKIGRIQWSFTDYQFGLIIAPDTDARGFNIDKKDGTKPTNLSYSGDIIWDDNHGNLTDSIRAATTEERALYW